MTRAASNAGRVSVIIPTFNYGHFIADCIKSVIQQEHDDCEIIVVDDGSNDDTAAVLEPFSSQIHYVYQDNQGLASARNTGLEHATGEFIQFLDSDDLLGKNALRGRLAFLQANPDCSIAVCRNYLFTRLGRHGQPVKKGRWELYQSHLALHLCRFNIAPPHALLLRRHVVDEVGEFDASLSACEDYDYWLRAVIRGFIPQFCPEGEVLYRVHSKSMSANRTQQIRHDAEMHLRLYDHLIVNNDFRVDALTAALLAFLTGVARTLSHLKENSGSDTLFERLTQKFCAGVKMLDESLNEATPGDNLVTRLYSQWFTYQLTTDADLLKHVEQFENAREIVTQNQRMTRILANIYFSLASRSGQRLEATRLGKISFATNFPKIAAALKGK